MDINQIALSQYKTVASINEEHNIFLVQNIQTNQFFVKKILDVYNLDIYKLLMRHPVSGTPQIMVCTQVNGQLIIIEEYLSGTSLDTIIHARNYTFYDIIHYMIELCNILEQFHNLETPIIHRDIKPSNIIVDKHNHILLLDFNAAKFYNASAANDTMLLGTPGYASPEQYGFGSSSPLSDIYSIGIIMKEMLSGISESSKDLESIADCCTKLDPKARFRNIQVLKQALMSISANPAHCDTPRTPVTNHSSNEHNRTDRNLSPKKNIPWLPPGFRSLTPWKMFLATWYYLLMTTSAIAMKSTGGPIIFVITFCLCGFIVLTLPPFVFCNYLNIQNLFPLCKSDNPFIKITGMILLYCGLALSVMLVTIVVETAAV